MLTFFLTLAGLARAFQRLLKEPEFRVLAGLAFAIWAGGTVFYHHIEGWSWIDSAYFCTVTLATVGYGDFHPVTDAGKIFTMAYILIGIGVFVAVFAKLAETLVEDRLQSALGRQRGRQPVKERNRRGPANRP